MDRSKNIDVVKGFGIILMVLGHCGFPFSHFIYLFHMAIFFIVSGYCYNSKYTDNTHGVLIVFKKRIRSLYIPYVVYSVAYLLLWNVFLKLNIYTDNINFLKFGIRNHFGLVEYITFGKVIKQFLLIVLFLGNGGQMGSALWFLRCLFAVTMCYTIIDFLLKKIIPQYEKIAQFIVAILFFLVAFWLSNKGIKLFGFDLILATYVLFYFGTLINNELFSLNGLNLKTYVFFLVSIITLLICNQTGSVELSARVYTNVVFFSVASLAGWFFMYSLSEIICKYEISSFFAYLGKNTIPIIGLHFLCFKIVSIFQILLFKLPLYMLSGFPVLISKDFWWLLYAVIGIGIPLLLNIPYKIVKRYLLKRVPF